MLDLLGFSSLLIGAGVLVYSYVLYPLLVWLLARLRPRPISESDWLPRISFIITAHNEERDIAAKLENTLALDYPRDRLEILVSSDGSTDRTPAIVEKYQPRGVRLVGSSVRSGKALATQRAVRESTGELLVFSDATGMYNTDSLRRLAASAADPSVGAVCGRVEYERARSLVGSGHRLYWRFEKALRRAESAAGTITVVSGSIHAARKELFPPAAPHQNYDLLLPLVMAERGLRTVFEERAVSRETPSRRTRDEYRARVRAGIRAFSYLAELRRRGWVMNYPFFTWAVASHKLMRWFSPLWLILLLLGNLLLTPRGDIWMWALVPHLSLYAVAAFSALVPAGPWSRWMSAPLFLGTTCAGFFVGWLRYLRGQRAASWETAR